MTGDSRPFAGSEEAARAGRKSGNTDRREVTCPKCGREFANLPQHLPACDGEFVTDGGRDTGNAPVAWIYEIRPPKDDEWFERTSKLHPIDDENLDSRDDVEIRNIRGLVEVEDVE